MDVLEDQYGFILHHQVMEHEKDVGIAVSMVAEAKRRFPALAVCSFDNMNNVLQEKCFQNLPKPNLK